MQSQWAITVWIASGEKKFRLFLFLLGIISNFGEKIKAVAKLLSREGSEVVLKFKRFCAEDRFTIIQHNTL